MLKYQSIGYHTKDLRKGLQRLAKNAGHILQDEGERNEITEFLQALIDAGDDMHGIDCTIYTQTEVRKGAM